jgi:hypothetical protein
MEFHVQIDIKNACSSLKWMNSMATLQMYATRFQQVLLNQILKMSFHLLLHLRQQLLQHQTQQQLLHKTRRTKLKKKIELLLEHVVGNSGALISSFQESTNILKNMDRNFAALLEKL